MRVKIIANPSGLGFREGSIMTVPDPVGRQMVKGGRAIEWTEKPESAGTTTTGAPSPTGERILGEAARRQAAVAAAELAKEAAKLDADANPAEEQK